MWSGAWIHCCAYGESNCRVRPFGRQKAVGSSTLAFPVAFRRSKASPPGLYGAKFLGSYPVTLGVSVSLGPTTWEKPGPAQTPVKFGLPSAARGILAWPFAACCSAHRRTIVVTIKDAHRLDILLLGSVSLGRRREHLVSISERDLVAGCVGRAVFGQEPFHL